MKCKQCEEHKAELLTINGNAICSDCVNDKDCVVCVRCGQIVEVEKGNYFTDMPLCPKCFEEGEE